MANKFYESQKSHSKPPSPGLGRESGEHSTPDKTANWPTHGGTSGPMGKSTPKVKQSAKTTL